MISTTTVYFIPAYHLSSRQRKKKNWIKKQLANLHKTPGIFPLKKIRNNIICTNILGRYYFFFFFRLRAVSRRSRTTFLHDIISRSFRHILLQTNRLFFFFLPFANPLLSFSLTIVNGYIQRKKSFSFPKAKVNKNKIEKHEHVVEVDEKSIPIKIVYSNRTESGWKREEREGSKNIYTCLHKWINTMNGNQTIQQGVSVRRMPPSTMCYSYIYTVCFRFNLQ